MLLHQGFHDLANLEVVVSGDDGELVSPGRSDLEALPRSDHAGEGNHAGFDRLFENGPRVEAQVAVDGGFLLESLNCFGC